MTQTAQVVHREYEDYRAAVGPDRQLWENNGWSVRGRSGDDDYLLWVSPYAIQGLAGESYRAGRFAVNQTLLIWHDIDAPDELVDNDFVAVGWDPDEYFTWDELAVHSTADSTSWSLGGRTMTAAPPRWSIAGEHAGVGTSLEILGRASPLWFTDPAEDLTARADRWWIGSGDVHGSLSVDGRTLPVDGAHGVHERHIHCGLAHDPVRLLRGAGIVWFTVTSPELSGYVMARPSLNASWAQFTVDGVAVELVGTGISSETVRTWFDPVTGMVVGQAWRVRVVHHDLTITLSIQARARAYYSWNFLSEGSTMLYWWLAVAEATIEGPDGSRTVRDMPAEAHLNRTFYLREGPSPRRARS